MTATQIIQAFELQVDDITELSSTEELQILNRVYQKVCNNRPWEFLKVNATGTMSSDATGYYITLPDYFAYFAINNEYTDNTIGVHNTASPAVIFVGTNLTPYQIVNFSDRRQYANSTGYAYLSLSESKIRFTGTPVSTTYDFDYVKFPATLTASDTPVIPARFQDILVYGMAVENDILQLSPKAKSYAPENQAQYENWLEYMAAWNSRMYMN